MQAQAGETEQTVQTELDRKMRHKGTEPVGVELMYNEEYDFYLLEI